MLRKRGGNLRRGGLLGWGEKGSRWISRVFTYEGQVCDWLMDHSGE